MNLNMKISFFNLLFYESVIQYKNLQNVFHIYNFDWWHHIENNLKSTCILKIIIYFYNKIF